MYNYETTQFRELLYYGMDNIVLRYKDYYYKISAGVCCETGIHVVFMDKIEKYPNGQELPTAYEEIVNLENINSEKNIEFFLTLPEEAHSSGAYIKLKPDGTFHEMRIYDKEHYLTHEIAYHPEPRITGNRHDNVLHIHTYNKEIFSIAR